MNENEIIIEPERKRALKKLSEDETSAQYNRAITLENSWLCNEFDGIGIHDKVEILRYVIKNHIY